MFNFFSSYCCAPDPSNEVFYIVEARASTAEDAEDTFAHDAEASDQIEIASCAGAESFSPEVPPTPVAFPKTLPGRPVSNSPLLSATTSCSNDSDEARGARRRATQQAVQFNKELPPGLVKVCILGDAEFKSPDTQELVKAVAASFCEKLQNKAVVLTFGQRGVQSAFCEGLKEGGFPDVFHLMPLGHMNSYGYGTDLSSNTESEADVKEAFARLGQVLLTFEGESEVATMANDAFSRGTVVVPCACTGGASAGDHGFMAEALARPKNVSSKKEWAMLKEVPYKKGVVARAVTAIVEGVTDRSNGGLPDNGNKELRSQTLHDAPPVNPDKSPVVSVVALGRASQRQSTSRTRPQVSGRSATSSPTCGRNDAQATADATWAAQAAQAASVSQAAEATWAAQAAAELQRKQAQELKRKQAQTRVAAQFQASREAAKTSQSNGAPIATFRSKSILSYGRRRY